MQEQDLREALLFRLVVRLNLAYAGSQNWTSAQLHKPGRSIDSILTISRNLQNKLPVNGIAGKSRQIS